MNLLPPLMLAAALTAALMACGGGEGSSSESQLTSSVSSLALAASGTARLITITNRGPLAARALLAEATGLPSGSSLRSTCPAALQPGATCVLLVTPGSTPSATPGDLAPTVGKVTVSAANAKPLAVDVAVVTYGSVYQGGYVFDLNDNTPLSASIDGKVLDTIDFGIEYWSPSLTAITGINENSTPGSNSCDGAVDGRCNTARIMAQYSTGVRNFPAAMCADSTNGGHADWYLPALCEMVYNKEDVVGGVCGTPAAPRLFGNVLSRLYDQRIYADLFIFYWTSTQSSASPANDVQLALIEGDGPGTIAGKGTARLPTRCARHLTP